MSPHPDAPPTDSLQKKRERDRRAQQNVRNKRLAHVTSLELRIVALEGELRDSRETCDGLRQEIEVLRGRQGSLQHLVASWGDGSAAAGSLPSPHPSVHSSSAGLIRGGTLPSTPAATHHPAHDDRTEAAEDAGLAGELHLPTTTTVLGLLNPSPWNMVPAHIPERDVIVTDCFSAWLQRPDLVRASPESPRPLELLYGSKRNFLANTICETIQQWPCREPERIAVGWLVYHIMKWMLQPSEARFARLRDFQRPVPEQLCQPHPYYVDFYVWPALRANLIRHRGAYDDRAVVGLMSCCLKVRWPWNAPFLEPNDDDQLVLKPEFYDTITNLGGWGLTKEFFDRYPFLVEGLDPGVLYELC